MSEHGLISIDRGLFGHHRFENEPLTEREAWIWMIGQAAFRPHCKRVGPARVTLKRGEFAHSIRYMAEAWQWSKSRVHRFLERLAATVGDDGPLIGTHTKDGVTVVSICKYNDYQSALHLTDDGSGTANGTPAGQVRDKEESIDKGVVVGGEDAPARENPDNPTAADYEIAKAFLVAIKRDPDDPWQSGIAYQAVVWRKRGYERAQIIADAAEILTGENRAKVPLSYFFSAIERRHVQREQQARDGPPTSSPKAAFDVLNRVSEPSHAKNSAVRPAATFQQSRDNFRTAHNALKGFIAEADAQAGDGGEGGDEIVQPAATPRRR